VRMGRNMAAFITGMSQPLGRAAGNAVEVIETVEALQGRGPADLVELTIELGAAMLALAGAEPCAEPARARLRRALESGAACERFAAMIGRHGGDPALVERPDSIGRSPFSRAVNAEADGFVLRVDAGCVGRSCLLLGAGRSKVTDPVDPHAGVTGLPKIGEFVGRGQPVATLHSSRADRLDAAEAALREGLETGDKPREIAPLITGRIAADTGNRTS